MEREKWPFIFSIVSAIALSCAIVFYFFLEIYHGGFWAGIITLILVASNIVSMIFSIKHRRFKIVLTQSLLTVMFVVSIFFSISRFLLFGVQVSEISIPEEFGGSQHLIFYSRGACVIECMGIINTSYLNYANFEIKHDTILVPMGWAPYFNPKEIVLDGKSYEVQDSENIEPNGPPPRWLTNVK